jgi:carboxymethylenebutenolidase
LAAARTGGILICSDFTESTFMGEFNTLMARDGHEFRAYLAAPPPGRARGALVVIQEIYGINSHMRAVTDGYAAEGYLAIAPSLFDRARRGVELDYNDKTTQEGFGYVKQLKRDEILRDLAASIAVVKHGGRVGSVGFCWGGGISYLAACELPLAAAVCYYGGSIVNYLDKKPKCPVLYHFAEQDTYITPEDRAKIKAVHPEGIHCLYPANHAFNRDVGQNYEPKSAALARERTLRFFAKHVAGEND